MTGQPHVEAARARAETTLLDRCRILRASTTAPTWDQDTGQTTPAADDVVYDGPCSVHADLMTQSRVLGDAPTVVSDYTIRVPVSATGVHAGDGLVVTAVHRNGDPDLAGTRFEVRAVDRRTRVVLRKLDCNLVSSSLVDR